MTDTRRVILSVAERLYAEAGIAVVSNRQVNDAAGQGNNAAVHYHFGSKAELVRAIAERHFVEVEDRRRGMLGDVVGSTDLRGWLSCLVRPSTDYLAELGSPTWYARFNARVFTEPSTRDMAMDAAMSRSSLPTVVAGMDDCLRSLPYDVRATRSSMARMLMTHVTARHEAVLAQNGTCHDAAASWHTCGTDLIDALEGLWRAPVTRVATSVSPNPEPHVRSST